MHARLAIDLLNSLYYKRVDVMNSGIARERGGAYLANSLERKLLQRQPAGTLYSIEDSDWRFYDSLLSFLPAN